MKSKAPTSHPEVNDLLHRLLASVQATLGSRFIGMYLEGSLTSDDWDEASDIDFVVVTDDDITNDRFASLQALHERIAALPSRWATELEGSYIPLHALRRHDPAHALHPNIERGPGERLKLAQHDAAWVIHRSILRERGITLVGPAPQTLIDPVSPDDLRQAVVEIMHGWATSILDDPSQIRSGGYQSYTVLSLCRILYTMHHGTVASKRLAANWAQASLGQRWAPLIERAWDERRKPHPEAAAADVEGTLDFIRYTLEHSRPWERPPEEA